MPMLVAQVSKPAVSPTSSRQTAPNSRKPRFRGAIRANSFREVSFCGARLCRRPAAALPHVRSYPPCSSLTDGAFNLPNCTRLRQQSMRTSFPIRGLLAMVLLLAYGTGVLFAASPTLSAFCFYGSLPASIFAVKSAHSFDRMLGRIILAVLVVLLLMAIFVPALSH